MILYVLTVLLFIITGLLSAYLFVVTVAAFLFRKTGKDTTPAIPLGVLTPAHDEAAGIGKTIAAVRACDYPPEKLRILVIADNCTDETATRARDAGAVVVERTDSANRGKGQALNWFLTTRKDLYQDLDGLTIIDADTEPDPGFLREMALSLSDPTIQAVQGYNGVANPGTNWRTGLVDAAFNVFNHLRMAGLSVLAGTCTLKGNGMGFRTDLLEHYGWPAHSVVEDMEFSVLLTLDGVRVGYNPNAVIRSQMVASGRNAASQRTRWEGGRFTVIRSLLPDLRRMWRENPGPSSLFFIIDLLFPPLSLHVLVLALTTLFVPLFLPEAVPGVVYAWLILIGYVLAGQIQRRAPLTTWLYLASAPVFILWKIPIYIKVLIGRKTSTWTRTARE